MKPSEEVTDAAGASHITYAADMVFSSSRTLSGASISHITLPHENLIFDIYIPLFFFFFFFFSDGHCGLREGVELGLVG
jgi:hypothetical protein